MTSEQIYFMEVLSNYVNATKSSCVPESIDKDIVLQYVKKHELQAIFYKQMKEPRLLQAYSSTIYYYHNRLNTLKVIDSLLSSYDYFIVKGTEIAKYYPDPSLRSMGDTDITVHYEDKKEVAEKLRMAGFKFGDTTYSAEWHFYKSNMDFELHHALLYGSEVTNRYVQFFCDCFEHVTDHTLEPNYHFVYLLVHLRKHILENGAGFRQFMDIAMFYKAVDNWQQIKEWLEQIELSQFASIVTELIYCWWKVECPLRRKISDEFYAVATESIFQNGVFGFGNEYLRMNTFVKTDNVGTQNTLRRIFPPIKVFQHYAGYEFLVKSKLLYPVAVIKHLVDYFKGKAEYRKKYKEFIPDKEYVRERKAYLKSWGL